MSTTPETTLASTTDENGNRTIVHRFAWTTEERVLTAVSPVAFAALGLLLGTLNAFLISTALGFVASGFLYHLGRSRKEQSSVRMTIGNDAIVVKSKGFVRDSRVTISTVDSISYNKFGSYQCFIVSGDGTAARVPARFAVDDEVRTLLASLADQAKVVTAEARDLFDLVEIPVRAK